MNTIDAFQRQREILVPEDLIDLDVHIVGVGALGGAVLVTLCKLGFGVHNRIVVWDDDRCEAHNEPNQWYTARHVGLGMRKVEAMHETIGWLCEGRDLEPVPSRFTGSEPRLLGPVVIVAVDSIEQRRIIWQNLRSRDDVELLIDARMGAEIVDVYCVDFANDDAAAYEASLSDDEEPFEEPGCRQSIFYNVLCAGGFVGSLLRAWAKGEPLKRHVLFDSRNFLIDAWDH